MKRNTVILLALIFSFGCIAAQCAGLQDVKIDENARNQAIAYASGKAMGIAITKIEPNLNEPLGAKWDAMMAKAGAEPMMSPENIIVFFNEALAVIAVEVGDKYNLIGDLSVLLMIFGAEYDSEGNLISINPVPVSVLNFFSIGYDSGVKLALAD